MPPKSKKGNYKRKRGYKKRSQRFTRQLTFSKTPLGNSHIARLRYCSDPATLNPGVGGTAAAAHYVMNGLYDPEVIIGGHSPMGFDELMQMYDHYVVLGAKVQVKFVSLDTNYTQYVLCRFSDQATSYTDMKRMIENGNCRWDTVSKYGTTRDTKTFTLGINPIKFLGSSVKDDSIKGDGSSNPVEKCYLSVYASPEDMTTDTAGVRVHVIVDYLVKFIEPKALSLS